MNISEMIYAGELLSDYKLVIAGFEGRGGDETITTDSQRSFNSVSMFNGKYHPFVSTVYEEALEMEFTLIKDICQYEDQEFIEEFSQEELRKIKRWLSRPLPHKLQFPDVEGFEDVFWMGSFNVEEVYVGGMPCGLHLTFTSTRPFGLRTESYYEGTLDVGDELTITDGSDDEGHTYIFLQATTTDGGDFELSIANNGKTRSTVVKNCTPGEVLTFSPLLQVVSSVDSHELGDDFNYVFPRIANAYYNDTRENVISTSIPIDYIIRYNEIVKAVIA